jgi:hypothetical protein
MQNAGLPEAGDLVITFAPDVMADPGRYANAATLPEAERTTAGSGAAARARRDAAVEAFVALRDANSSDGGAALRQFHQHAVQRVHPLLCPFEQVWRDGPLRAATATGDQLRSLADGTGDHLAAASVHRLPPPTGDRRMGCCGTLGTYLT